MTLRVGLTGGIASGKSTILKMFAELGVVTVDADAIVARLYEPGQPGHEALVRTYGPSILLPDGRIDRPKLASVAFSSEAEAKKLNALIHPIVMAEEARMSAATGAEIFMVEATLLLEAGGRQRYDRIVIVDVDPAVQLERAVARGMTRDEAARRMAHQMPRAERLSYADYAIDNSGDVAQARREVQRVYDLLKTEV